MAEQLPSPQRPNRDFSGPPSYYPLAGRSRRWAAGVIDADVTTYRDSLGGSSEAILVTGDSSTTGTDAGDLPPLGSEFDIVNDGGGYETVYSDLVSTTGANVISETWVTPMGDFALPATTDLAANLADSSLFVPTSLADLASGLF